VKIEIQTSYVVPRPGGPLKVTMMVDGKVVAEGEVPISAPLLFTANDLLGHRHRAGLAGFARLWRQGPI
jgi:hypothetical protein